MTNVIEVETAGRLRILRLNRPERKNALNNELMGALVREIWTAAHDDEVWVVAITGNGDAFCSGLDLASVGGGGGSDRGQAAEGADAAADPGEDVPRHLPYLLRVACEKPVVAGINGVAVGIGVSLAMACDIRIAAPSARLHPGYARVGTSPDGGSTWTITQALGYERAMRYFLESRALSGAEAAAIGLVSEVTETDEAFPGRFLEYSQSLTEVAPIAARQTKRMLGRAVQLADLVAHFDEEVRLTLSAFTTEDSREAIRAMAARDRPKFTGR